MLSSVKNYLANQARKPSGWFGRTVATRVFDHENKPMQQFGLELMDPEEDDRVLEIGFGNGYFLSRLMPRIESGKVCGIDFSGDMVRVAADRNRGWVEKGMLEIRKASIAGIPYPDDHFDKVFTANTIYFWPEPVDNLREVKRVLRPDGEFYCGMRMKEQMEAKNSIVRENKDVFRNLYRKEDAIGLFERAGFEDPNLHHRSNEKETYYVLIGRV